MATDLTDRGYSPNGHHKGFTLWFTGLSGSGKSTLSHILAERLREAGARVEVLDGDIVRTNLSKGLGVSASSLVGHGFTLSLCE